MGTSSMIGFYNEDGSVTATYCHYDGYLEYNGRMLVENYNTIAKAKAVATCGYLSGLVEDLSQSIVEAVHSQDPIVYASPEVFLKCGSNHAGADYLYLFDGEAWFFAKPGNKFEEVEINLK
jgi:hypothetical protein